MENTVAIIQVRESPPIVQVDEQPNGKQDNHDIARDESRWNSMHSLVIIAACILNTSVIISIPRKNSILYPEYWYEGLICVIAGSSFRDSCSHILELFIFTKLHIPKKNAIKRKCEVDKTLQNSLYRVVFCTQM